MEERHEVQFPTQHAPENASRNIRIAISPRSMDGTFSNRPSQRKGPRRPSGPIFLLGQQVKRVAIPRAFLYEILIAVPETFPFDSSFGRLLSTYPLKIRYLTKIQPKFPHGAELACGPGDELRLALQRLGYSSYLNRK
jgi:hypothetical protein